MTRRPTTLAAATAIGALALAGLAAPPASGASERRAVPRTTPAWVAGAHSLGRAASGGTSTFRLYLQPRGGTAAMAQDVAAVSDPASPSYRHFLGNAEFHATYDPSAADAARLTDYLRSNGLHVIATEGHRRYLSVRGTNAAVEKTFAVSLERFRHDGQDVQANTSAVTVPAELAGLVSTVTGLDTTARTYRHHASTPAGSRTGRPCSDYYGQKPATTKPDGTPLPKFGKKVLPYAVCGYRGSQLRAAYEGAGQTLTGQGVTVAIVDAYASPSIAQDAATYAGRNGGAPYGAGQLDQVVASNFSHNGQCGENGWWGEETLDVEAAHAMAPNADIVYYGAASCYDSDLLDTLQRAVDDNRASIVSNSWGDLEQNTDAPSTAAYQAIFMAGALKGIGMLFSSGDDGDEAAASGTKQVDYPTSDPYVTSVGGTSDAIGATNAFAFQTGWGTEKYALSGDSLSWTSTGFLYGAGGGVSTQFAKPSWQNGVVPGAIKNRAVPDTAMDADPTTGMLVGQTQKFSDGTYYDEYRIGGTSLASPLFAGMTALREQAAGQRLGFLNPAIYQNATTAFTDISGTPADAGNVRADYANREDASSGLIYSVRAFNRDSSLNIARGWDNVTGVGRPNTSWLTVPAP